MGKKTGIIIVVGICSILCGILIGWIFWGREAQAPQEAGQNEMIMSTGTYISTENGSHIFVFDNSSSPVVMINKTGEEGLFPDLSTGDRIVVVRDNYVMYSIPEQMMVYMYCRIGEGERTENVQQAIDSLESMGWMVNDAE